MASAKAIAVFERMETPPRYLVEYKRKGDDAWHPCGITASGIEQYTYDSASYALYKVQVFNDLNLSAEYRIVETRKTALQIAVSGKP
jgi:hypothetical protein